MNDIEQERVTATRPGRFRTVGWTLLALGLGLALGFAPMWTRERALNRDLQDALTAASAYADSMEVARLHVLVSAALVEVERNDTERARSLMSRFYEGVDAHWQGVGSVLVPAAVNEIRKTRDQTITLLSRGSADGVFQVRSAHALFLAVADPSAEDIGRALMPTGQPADSTEAGGIGS